MYELQIDRPISSDQIHKAISYAFNISNDLIVYVEDWDAAESLEGEVYFTLDIRKGDFPSYLCIYFHGEATRQDFPPELEVAKAITMRLSCKCLISDGSVNPYTWLLVDEACEVCSVSVDADVFGNRGEFYITAREDDTG
jgi:hypothetical protein